MMCIVEKLANTERHLNITKNHSLRAEDNTDELKKLNKSIFNPSAALTWNKEAKRKAKEGKIQARYDEDREERERGLMEVRDTEQNRGNFFRARRGRSPTSYWRTTGRTQKQGVGFSSRPPPLTMKWRTSWTTT
jgi:hypothetical protein